MKRTNRSQSQFVTPAFLAEQLDRQAEKIFDFIKQQRTLIETRMDFYRKDAKEQINSLASSLAKTTAELHGRMDRIEAGMDTIWNAVKDNKNEIIAIQKKLQEHDRRFEQIDQRFEQIDQRFEQIDQRFEQIDQRFERMDQRFERMDQRFDRLELRMGHMEQRMGRMEEKMDLVADTVGRHGTEIADLRTSVSHP